MKIKELIDAISKKHSQAGIEIYPPASESDIAVFEMQMGFVLPNDFKEFYSLCNGFGCTEDIFNMIPLNAIDRNNEYRTNYFDFAEYMIYSDSWSVRIVSPTRYQIFNDPELTLTTSLKEFLERFLRGNVFDPGGLYDWHEEVKTK